MVSMVDNNQMIVVNVIIWSINVNLVDYVITILINLNLQSWLKCSKLRIMSWGFSSGYQWSMLNVWATPMAAMRKYVFFNDHPMCKWGTSWGTSVNKRVINHFFMACFMVP